MARKTVTVILCYVEGQPCFHFCQTKLQGEDLWFPMSTQGDMLASIERVMQVNRVALNVTSISVLRKRSTYTDVSVTYNEWEN